MVQSTVKSLYNTAQFTYLHIHQVCVHSPDVPAISCVWQVGWFGPLLIIYNQHSMLIVKHLIFWYFWGVGREGKEEVHVLGCCVWAYGAGEGVAGMGKRGVQYGALFVECGDGRV